MAGFQQQEVLNPHFRLPLQFGGIGGGAIVNEQDESNDVMDCVRAIIAFPIGTRQDMPDFGIPDLVFKRYDQSVVDQVRTAIDDWEDRVSIDIDSSLSVTDQMIWNLLVKVRVTSDSDHYIEDTGPPVPRTPALIEGGIDGGTPATVYPSSVDGGGV